MGSNLDRLFLTDRDAEDTGNDFILDEGVSIRLRRFQLSDEKVKASFALYHKPFARQIQLDTLPQEKQREILIKIFVKSSVVGWKGIVIDGVETPYSPAVAIDLFKRLPDLFETLYKYAEDFRNFKHELGDTEAVGES